MCYSVCAAQMAAYPDFFLRMKIPFVTLFRRISAWVPRHRMFLHKNVL
jgi:hypothetical protein